VRVPAELLGPHLTLLDLVPEPVSALRRRAMSVGALTFNRRDLAALGMSSGDRVRVSTRRGMVELVARVDPAIAEGMVFIPFCYAEAPANRLTNPQLDPFGKIPEFKFCAARVEKVEAAAAAE